jgi:hypothetical protein
MTRIIFLITFSTKFFLAFGQYNVDFQSEFKSAMYFYKNHEKKFSKKENSTGLTSKFLFCIVAPEVSQHNSIVNDVQLYSMKLLYVQNGTKYGDFSLGIFQMKPSFVEDMEVYVSKNSNLKKAFSKILFKDKNSSYARSTRLNRLATLDWQLLYLTVFCNIVKDRFSYIKFSNIKDKLKFYATAYNCGFSRSKEDIIKHQSMFQFPRFSMNKYNYSDISILFYNHIN